MYLYKNKTIKILTIGGGSGQYALLSGLRDLKNIEITAVASMADNGGSTGRLRYELGVLPPGDVLKCVIALSPMREAAKKIMLKTLKGDRRLEGHKAGNMLITMLSRYTGSFPPRYKLYLKFSRFPAGFYREPLIKPHSWLSWLMEVAFMVNRPSIYHRASNGSRSRIYSWFLIIMVQYQPMHL